METVNNLPRLIWDRMCGDCFAKQEDSNASVHLVTELKQKERMIKEKNIEGGYGKGISGVKDDKNKPMWNLLPWKALNGLVRVLTFGASKYSPNGWRTVPNAKERYISALFRHIYAIQMGESIDKESGLRHIDHVLCNAAFLSELED